MENIGGFGKCRFGNGGAETLQGGSREENGKIEIGDSIENFFPYNKIYAFGVQF